MSLELLRSKIEANDRLPEPALRRALRESARLSQDDLARAFGVTRATVSRWESGDRNPSGEHLVQYVELLDELRGRS